jgi:IS5 family transposase
MLRLAAAQVETLWDDALPIEVRQLPEDLAGLDELRCDRALMAPFVKHWEREAAVSGVSAADHGRPTLAIETYVRLMVLKQRHGWGYRTLVAEVSDSIHLRRFCRIALSERVPDESTVRKLTRRIGPETVNDVTRELICAAVREKRFRARAVRVDSTGSRPTSSTRPMRAWPRRASRRSRGRAASSPRRSPRRRRGCATAHGRWAAGCARSVARSAGARGRRRRRSWR